MLASPERIKIGVATFAERRERSTSYPDMSGRGRRVGCSRTGKIQSGRPAHARITNRMATAAAASSGGNDAGDADRSRGARLRRIPAGGKSNDAALGVRGSVPSANEPARTLFARHSSRLFIESMPAVCAADMIEDRLADFIDHMLTAANDACSFVDGMAKEDFLADKRTQQAVI